MNPQTRAAHTSEASDTCGVLITSAAGKTGIPTTLGLLEKGYRVRAFVRQDDARAQRLRRAGAEIQVGNLGDSRDIRKAMIGMSRAYFCPPTHANGLHYASVFAVEARHSMLEHIVTMGQWLAHESHPSLLTREVWLAQQIIDQLPGITHTNINVGWFAANYFFVLRPIAQLGMMPMPLGDGLNPPPSDEDIARVVVGALDRPDLHAGKQYRPTGPELLSPQQITDSIARALGRKVKYKPVSERMLLKSLQADRWPVIMQTQFVRYLDEYRRGVFAIGGATDAVLKVSGRPAEDFDTIAKRVVRQDPYARVSLGSRLSAMGNMARAMMTKQIDPIATERERDHALIKDGRMCLDAPAWVQRYGTHQPSESEGQASNMLIV